MRENAVLEALRGKVIVSCQASAGDPLDDLGTLRRLAASVLLGGAGALRAEGTDKIVAFRELTQLPIIGISKSYDRNGEVYITPTFEAATRISEAGAEIVALDCTLRRLQEAEPWPTLIDRIRKELRRTVWADIATLEDAMAAEEAGADIVATTLQGYTADTRHLETVDWLLVESLRKNLKVPVVVEGHISTPEEVKRAFLLGVHAVVIGSAITRPQTITARFVQASPAGKLEPGRGPDTSRIAEQNGQLKVSGELRGSYRSVFAGTRIEAR